MQGLRSPFALSRCQPAVHACNMFGVSLCYCFTWRLTLAIRASAVPPNPAALPHALLPAAPWV